MIKDFKIVTNEGLEAFVDVGSSESLYKRGQLQDIVNEVLNTYNTGIVWIYRGKEIKLIKLTGRVEGYPSVDLNYVIAIYFEDTEFKAPNNAVIYNADGTIHKRLEMPKLISERGEKYQYGSCFEDIMWRKNKEGKLITTISISFDRYSFEVRELNPETGVIGDLLFDAIH